MSVDAWLDQAEHDYCLAKLAQEKGYNEWAVFCASQALEKVIKATILTLVPGISNKELYEHNLHYLLAKLPIKFKTDKIEEDCKEIDDIAKYSRYPTKNHNGKPPKEMCTIEISQNVLEKADKLLCFYRKIYKISDGLFD